MRDRLARHGAPAPRLYTLHALARRILIDLERCPAPFDLDTRIPRWPEGAPEWAGLGLGQAPHRHRGQ
jgi:hypothetical protein